MRRSAIAWLFLTTVLWGISFVAMRAMGMIQAGIAPHAGSWNLACVSVATRYALSAAVVFAVWRGRGGITRKEMEQGIGLGFFHGLGLLLQTDGLAHTDASVSAFLTQCYCVLLPVWFALRNRTLPSARTMFSVALIMAGIALLAHMDWKNFRMGRGEGETLLCSVLFTAQILWLEKKGYRGNRSAQITLVMLAAVAILLAPLVLWQTRDASLIVKLFAPVSVRILMAVLVFFSTVAANLLMNRWQRHVTSTEAGLIYGTEPVYACVFALFVPSLLSSWFGVDYPNEHLTPSLLLGGGLMFAANILMQWQRV